MALAVDANSRTLMTRSDLCAIEFRPLATGAGDRPVSVWRHIVPVGASGGLVDDKKYQFRGGHRVGTVGSVAGWVLHILQDGYQQQHRIQSSDANIYTLETSLQHYEGLSELNANSIDYLVAPALHFPLRIHYTHEPGDEHSPVLMRLGITQENRNKLNPSTGDLIHIADLAHDSVFTLPTQHVHRVAYQFSGDRTSADRGTMSITWGEFDLWRPGQ